MATQEPDVERLRSLLEKAAAHLEWAQSFATGGPGTEDTVKEINRLLGAIYFALGVEYMALPPEDGDEG